MTFYGIWAFIGGFIRQRGERKKDAIQCPTYIYMPTWQNLSWGSRMNHEHCEKYFVKKLRTHYFRNAESYVNRSSCSKSSKCYELLQTNSRLIPALIECNGHVVFYAFTSLKIWRSMNLSRSFKSEVTFSSTLLVPVNELDIKYLILQQKTVESFPWFKVHR